MNIFTRISEGSSPAALANIENLNTAMADSKQRVDDAWAAVADCRSRRAAVERRVEEAKKAERNALSTLDLAKRGQAEGRGVSPAEINAAEAAAISARKAREAVEKELAPFDNERYECERSHSSAGSSSASVQFNLLQAVHAAEREQFAEAAAMLIRRLYVSRMQAVAPGQGIPSLKGFLNELLGIDVSTSNPQFVDQVKKEYGATLLEQYGLEVRI